MTFASAHNGGRSQVNLNFLNNSGEYLFLNLLKTADPMWTAATGSAGPITPDMLDADGYPTTFVNTYGNNVGSVYVDFYKPTDADRAGNHALIWDGNGTLYLGLSGTLISGSLTSSGGVSNNRAVVNFGTAGQSRLGISAIGSPHITNVRVVHVDDVNGSDETLLASGEVFGVKIKQRLAEGGFGIIRVLNLLGSGSGGNSSNLTNWYSRKPASYIWYSGNELRNELYSGLTALGTGGAYTASAPSICSANGQAWDGVLRDKTTLHILWDRSGFTGITGATSSGAQTVLAISSGARDANGFSVGQSITIAGITGGTWTGLNTTATVAALGTGTVTVNIDSSAFTGTALFTGAKLYHTSMTLNVGGTGAVQLYGSDAATINPASNRFPVAGASLSLCTVTYDAALNAWIMRGGNTAALIPIGLNNCMPLELMVRLCAETGAHLSFPVPFFCCTPATDLLPNLLWYIKNNAPSWLIPWIEGPNETWNPSGGFMALPYANAIANAYGWGTTDYHNWYGKAVSLLGQIASQIYGGDRTKYRMMCGVQTGTGGSIGSCATSDPRLSSAKFVANTGGLQTVQPDMVGPWGTITFSASAGVAEAKRWVTHICVANYFNPGLQGSTFANNGVVNEVDLAAAYAGGDLTAPVTYAASVYELHSVVTLVNGTPGQVYWPGHPLSVGSRVYFRINGSGSAQSGVGSSSVYWVVSVDDADHFTIATTSSGTPINFSGTSAGTISFTCFNGVTPYSLWSEKALHTNWKAWAQGFGVQKMCCYEGGYSPDYAGPSNVDLLKAASKNVTSMPSDPLGMYGALRTNYENFVGLTDVTFTAEFPSCFQLGGKSPSNNAWSVLETIYVSPSPPPWEAMRLFNARKRRLRVTT